MPERPTTVAAFLEAHPLPWRAAEVHALTGPEWDVLDATGHPVPNHGGIHYVREWAMVFAEMGNEVGQLRASRYHIYADGVMVTGNAPVQDHPDAIGHSIVRRPSDTAAPAAQQEGSRMAKEPQFWSVDAAREHLTATSIAEAIEQWADELHPEPIPAEVTVYGFAPMDLPSAERIASDALEHTLEWLSEDYGDPDAYTLPDHPAMTAAALAFAEAVRANYEVWACEKVTQVEVRTREYLPASWFPTPEATDE